jgi:5-methylcytosine-specific restriction endonuclease McrA
VSTTHRKASISTADRAAVLHPDAVCVVCGTDGTEYATNRFGEQYLNVLTVDHIQPEALGGINHLSNYRAMCKAHNSARGKKVDDERVDWLNPRYFPEVA